MANTKINKIKLNKQISTIVYIILVFALFNLSFYNIFTKKMINNYGSAVAEKSINLATYLPFDENSLIVHSDSNLKITENVPTIDGATALYPVYSAFVEALYPKESVQFDGTDFTLESSIQKTGTTTAFKRVIDGDIDIIFCAQPSKKQLEYAKEKNVELQLIPIGSEAFVFIVNSNNPIDNLSIEQLKGIYTGKYKNWNELGGNNSLISALQRAEGSGSQTAMLAFMNGEEMVKNYNMFWGKSIGYSFRYYIEDIVEDSNLKMISLDGIYPSIENIRNGTYPIVDNFYMIYRKDNTNENIEKIQNWILSEEGQEIIDETGYTSVINY